VLGSPMKKWGESKKGKAVTLGELKAWERCRPTRIVRDMKTNITGGNRDKREKASVSQTWVFAGNGEKRRRGV